MSSQRAFQPPGLGRVPWGEADTRDQAPRPGRQCHPDQHSRTSPGGGNTASPSPLRGQRPQDRRGAWCPLSSRTRALQAPTELLQSGRRARDRPGRGPPHRHAAVQAGAPPRRPLAFGGPFSHRGLVPPGATVCLHLLHKEGHRPASLATRPEQRPHQLVPESPGATRGLSLNPGLEGAVPTRPVPTLGRQRWCGHPAP